MFGHTLVAGLSRSAILISNKSLNWGLQALLFITVICIFVPFSPEMPGEGLDPSWVFGMNQAVAQGLAFGREVVFSFGPYASIYTKVYHPATDHLMLVGSLYLGLSYGLAVFLLTRNSRWYLLIAFWVVLAGLMYSRDALFYSYPLLVGLFCYQMIDAHEEVALGTNLTLALTIILFLPFGLFPLIKGSMLILCGTIAILSATFFAANRRWKLAIVVVASSIVSILIFWVASDQSVLNLPSYFISMSSIVSGYTEAMSSSGFWHEIVLYLVAVFILLIAILREDYVAIKSRAYILLVFILYFFLAFKIGFVRHDGHAIMSGTSILIASLLFAIVFHSRQIRIVLFGSVIVWMYIDSHYIKTSTESFSRNIKYTYSSAWSGVKNRLSKKEWLENEFNNTIKHLSDKTKFPLFEGTTDIYSYNQSYLIASGNNWNPRPILQSYSVYTPSLALKNKDHLLGEKAPDNVIFRVEPIDGRIPSIEDGASWPVLLTHYYPSALENDFLYLHKNPSIAKVSGVSLIGEGSYSFGDVVSVPGDSGLVFAEISIKQSAFGKLANILYKPSQLQISLNLESGITKTYRIISGMAKTGFLISPLVNNTTAFSLLYDVDYLQNMKVKSFFVVPVSYRSQWIDTYEVVFREITVPSKIDITKIYPNKVLVGSGIRKVAVAEKCDGSIDIVNKMSTPSQFSATIILNVQGWLATSADRGLLPDSVLLVLKDRNGLNTFIDTQKMPRPDVGVHFNNQTLDFAGFVSTADVSGIVGNYSLGLAFVEGDYVKICPEFSVPGTFKGITSHE